MTRIIIGPHTSVCIKPNNSFDLSLFPVINKFHKFHMIHNQKYQNILLYVT